MNLLPEAIARCRSCILPFRCSIKRTKFDSYEGLPEPTAADVQALISKFGAEQFIGNHFNRVIGRVESIGLESGLVRPERAGHKCPI